jgi:S-adenosylmethionine/arginine decarboxylase-like enzyme
MYDNLLLENTLIEALHKSGAHLLQVSKHQFYPHGFTTAVLLSESHSTLHSWPEKNEALIDFFSCSEDPKFDVFVNHFWERGFDIVSSETITR